jgi:hypothetical protein
VTRVDVSSNLTGRPILSLSSGVRAPVSQAGGRPFESVSDNQTISGNESNGAVVEQGYTLGSEPGTERYVSSTLTRATNLPF